MGAMTDMRMGGLVLIVSSVMTIFLGLVAPGGPLIDTVDQFDFIATSDVLAANSSLTHATSLLFAAAMLLFLYGLVVIWKASPTEGAVGFLSRIGILMVAFAVTCLIITMGLNHAIVHVLQHGVGSERTDAQLQDLALTLQTMKFSLRYIASTAAILGFIPLSLGMSTKFPAGFNKVAAQVAFVCSVLMFIVLLIGEHYHDISFELIYQIGLLMGAVLFVWVMILGVGFYRGVSGLSPGTSGGRVA